MVANNRLPILYPKHVGLYLQCPERYLHERVERRAVEQAPSPALARGIAVHAVLAATALEYQRSLDCLGGYDGPSVPCDLLARAEATLPRAPYPSEEAWQADARAVAEEAKYGLSYLDGNARVLATEVTFFRTVQGTSDCPPCVLAAKNDLVLLRQDQERRAFLDVVDHKSGNGTKPDPIQALIARIVVKHNAPTRFDVAFEYVQNTTLFLGARQAHSKVIDANECAQWWDTIRGAARGILAGTEWPPNPSPLCEWCPFFGNGCSLAPGGEASDGLDDSLEGVAD